MTTGTKNGAGQLRKQSKWSFSDARLKVVNNFDREFRAALKKAGIKGHFHDFRRTAMSNLLANGMTEHDVMNLAGHSNLATKHKFYLAVTGDLIGRASVAATQGVGKNLLQ